MSVAAPSCDYGGVIKEIKSVDALTVEFDLCVPDPAFLSKVAFSVFSVQPKEYVEYAMADGKILEKPVGTGPYYVENWARGDSITFKRNDNYWGEKAKTQTLVFKWAAEGAARLLELQSGTVDGIDNPTPDDFEKIKSDATLQLKDREALNVFYIGMTNTHPPFDNVKVRQAVAMGIDRQRIVDNFMPKGSTAASHFTPCSIPNGCVGEEWYAFDPAAAKALLAEGLAEAGFTEPLKTTITYRDVVRGYLPEPGVVATDIQAQLKENLNIDAEIVQMESGAFIDATSSGLVGGLHLLGWGADYPHVTNFLDYHFGMNQAQFGNAYPDIYENLQKGAQIADAKEAEPFYVAANNAIKANVPMLPVSHAGSATAFRADVEGAHASPLTNESFSVMKPGERDTFVWMQNAEPISMYCTDETDGESLRACEQVLEALLSYEVGGTAVLPGLATSCDSNEDLTVWTCHLRDGVKFHDGSKLDASDVVQSWAVAWDAANPLHKGNTGAFEYMTTLWGSLINVPAE
ncbi:MAG: peptide ABC transporter substrate-binding protein [Anaerolinea sp.]|nr:peptide ABC transporter substrate-binding protein [Anaerolinea sp.]